MPRWSVYLIYNLLLPLVLLASLPGYALRMVRRGNYRRHFLQRFGFYKPEIKAQIAALDRPFWIHAVSVGEVLIALKLIGELRRREPGLGFVLSTTTSTGFALANEKAASDEAIVPIYNPVDFRSIVSRVMRRINPRGLALVEAEVWPNLVARARKNQVPITLVNARLSDRSERRFRKVRALVRPVFAQLDHALVQDENDIGRIAMLGVETDRIRCVGSVKFDPQGVEQPAEQVEKFRALVGAAFGDRLADKKILLAASTHDGEEALLGQVYQQLRAAHPDLFYFVVPRHFERAAEVKGQLEEIGLKPALRSKFDDEGDGVDGDSDCLIIDSTGELFAWYYLVDLVVIGKSFLSTGGQNPVEAVLAGKPVLFGPHMENFRALVEGLTAAGGAKQVPDTATLAEELASYLGDPDRAAAAVKNARGVVDLHDGATSRTATMLLGE